MYLLKIGYFLGMIERKERQLNFKLDDFSSIEFNFQISLGHSKFLTVIARLSEIQKMQKCIRFCSFDESADVLDCQMRGSVGYILY